MSVFKCKMCGGALEIKDGVTVCECEYCGTKQTLPKLDNDRKANLYDRANHFRRGNEYDKAMGIYEQILNEDSTDSEAYWSLVLCRYGIEYVEDPSTHKRVPTVNRAQFTSIYMDEDYKSALQYADDCQKEIYEQEAKLIDEIQKGILAISQKEEPFDVFICYKETDNNGRRTQDSVIANDLYHQLRQEGFKVFFSRITLEDKLGTAYEPYIFAALNSAKVMVVLGTKPEYFNAVWVKNEWSRYLVLVKKSNGKKMLIPAYRDMDPYDLPEEFSHLQAQDMTRLGFMQDLIRGIRKIIFASESEVKSKETVIIGANNVAIDPLLERVFIFLEDGKWEDANRYCEKVLDIDPKNAQAYLGKLMAELHVKKRKQLAECAKPFDDRDNYDKLIRFGGEAIEKELRGYIAQINDRNENTRLTNIYNKAKRAMNVANTEEKFIAVAKIFETISGFKDSDELVKQCYEKAELCRIDAEKAVKKLKKEFIIGTPIVCVCIAFIIVLTTVIIPQHNYNKALSLINDGKFVEAYERLVELKEYKDSATKAKDIFAKYEIEKLKDAEVGDIVVFGSYEQDNNTSNGKEEIEWRVLKKEDGKILVISDKALDYQQYNSIEEKLSWEKCTLRKWLNNNFINVAFSADEKANIPSVTVSDICDGVKCATTQDQVFLLSYNEAFNDYFSSDNERECEPTEYAVARGVYNHETGYGESSGNCNWLLRTPRSYPYEEWVYFVEYNGSYDKCMWDNTYHDCAVRPALWINLNF